MKPIAEWTLGQKLKVLQYLTNIDYVEIVLEMGSYKEDDKTVFEIPIVVRKFMEKEMPEVWEKYLRYCDELFTDTLWDMAPVLNAQLNLDNLLIFLMENKGMWGWIGGTCNHMNCPPNSEKDVVYTCSKYENNECAGKVKHPALLYAEGV